MGRATVLARVLRIVAIVAAVAAIAVFSYAASRPEQPMVGVVTSAGSASIEATDQVGPAGRLVVHRVVAPDDSWVVAYIAEAGGTTSAFVGAAQVHAGRSLDVIVPLQGHVSMSQKLVLVLNADRGVRGRFEFDPARFDISPDKPYYVNGGEVRVALKKDVQVAALDAPALMGGSPGVQVAPGTAALEVADRLMVIDRLVVDRVLAPADSWIAVYLVGDDGVPTQRVGLARVPRGESLSVEVPVDTDVNLTEKLLVALQVDLGVASTIEFDPARPAEGADKPYVVDGVELSKAVFTRPYGMDADNMAGEGGGGMSAP
jgi:hypothetical protein